MTYTIAIADDSPAQLHMLSQLVESSCGAEIIPLRSGKQVLDYIPRAKPLPNLLLLDLKMPEIDGLNVLEQLKPYHSELPIIIITAYGDVRSATTAMRLGAVNFIQKEESPERIAASIRSAIENAELRKEVQKHTNHLGRATVSFEDIIGESPILTDAKIIAERAAESTIGVLLKGESGVGKELFAHAIHNASKRAKKPFVAVNCGAIPENLIESTLFGHERGAFTGATKSSIGKFREASGGTIFLDEIGELSLTAQVRLLRVLQNKEVEPVGGAHPKKVDVRIIAATNKSLSDEVRRHTFREDLYYRLNIFPIKIPSLHTRGPEDILTLADYFAQRIAAQEGKTIKAITPNAQMLLKSHRWPGNVRQLENKIFRAVVLTDDDTLDVADFPALTSAPVEGGVPHYLPATRISLTDKTGEFRTLHAIETETIRAALQHYNWKMSKAARALGIGRSTLYRRVQELGLQVENPKKQHSTT